MTTPQEDESLHSAEEQMIKHELGMSKALFAKLSDRLGGASRILKEAEPRPLTDDEIQTALKEMLAEDPEARELAGRLGTYWQFRAAQHTDDQGDE